MLDLLLILDIQGTSSTNLVNKILPKKPTIAKKANVKIENTYITLTKNPTPILTPIPTTQIQTPAPTQIPSIILTPTITQAENQSQLMLDQVNDFRKSKGLSPVHSDGYTCGFANTRAPEVTSSFTHDGFTNRINSKTLPYPSYSNVTENIAENSDPNQVVPAWIASPGHNENMQKDTPYVCIANSGSYYIYEGWKP